MEKSIIKIALTGPESTGKSTLSSWLAHEFNTLNTIEFARGFLEERNNTYNYHDIIFMAEQQLALENKMSQQANKILFCDTDFINFKIWLEHEGHKVPSWLENHIASKPYQLSLLLKPDIPWEPDPLRGFPKKRDYFYQKFKENLMFYNYKFTEIHGEGLFRKEMTLKAVQEFLDKSQ